MNRLTINYVRKITLLLFFSIPIFAYSTDIEDYFGKYQSINSEIKIKFILNEHGILGLSVNEVCIDSTSFTYDYLGIFFGTMTCQMDFNDNNMNSYCIQLYIVQIEEEIILVSGYFMQYKYKEGDKIKIIKKQVLEFSFEKLEINISDCVVKNDTPWDVDFIDEKVNKYTPDWLFNMPALVPDGKGPNLERFGGIPYDFIPETIQITFPTPAPNNDSK